MKKIESITFPKNFVYKLVVITVLFVIINETKDFFILSREEFFIMELLLSVSFGVWFIISALFYGFMVKRGYKE